MSDWKHKLFHNIQVSSQGECPTTRLAGQLNYNADVIMLSGPGPVAKFCNKRAHTPNGTQQITTVAVFL